MSDIDGQLAAQDAAAKARREARWTRIRAVRAYLHTLDDPDLRKVAYLLGKGFQDEMVCKHLNLSPSELEEAKNRLRQGLVEAGVAPQQEE